MFFQSAMPCFSIDPNKTSNLNIYLIVQSNNLNFFDMLIVNVNLGH